MMKFILKKVKDTPAGRTVEEKETAIIEFDGKITRVKCFDIKLKQKLEEILSLPFTRRKPVIKEGVRAFAMEMLNPNTPEYIKEITYLLRKANFHVITKAG